MTFLDANAGQRSGFTNYAGPDGPSEAPTDRSVGVHAIKRCPSSSLGYKNPPMARGGLTT